MLNYFIALRVLFYYDDLDSEDIPAYLDFRKMKDIKSMVFIWKLFSDGLYQNFTYFTICFPFLAAIGVGRTCS